MKKLLVTLLILLLPNTVFGAIARDTSADVELASGTSVTLSSYVVSDNTNGMIACGIEDSNAAGVSGVTFNTSENFTQRVISDSFSGTRSVWTLENPTQTTADIVVSFSGTTAAYVGCANYTDVNTGGVPDDTDWDNIAPSTSSTLNFTTNADDCWSFAVVEGDNGSVTAGTNAFELQQDSLDRRAIFDSNGSLGTAGAKTMSFTMTNSNGGSAGITFCPSVAAGGGNKQDIIWFN